MIDGRVDDSVTDTLAGLWDKLAPGVDAALEARERERTETLENRLATRREREIADVNSVMNELQRRIEEELAEPEGQLELFTVDERLRHDHDVEALQARLIAIPDEIERETERIRRRYAEADPRLFPFALVFVVPRSIAGGWG